MKQGRLRNISKFNFTNDLYRRKSSEHRVKHECEHDCLVRFYRVRRFSESDSLDVVYILLHGLSLIRPLGSLASCSGLPKFSQRNEMISVAITA